MFYIIIDKYCWLWLLGWVAVYWQRFCCISFRVYNITITTLIAHNTYLILTTLEFSMIYLAHWLQVFIKFSLKCYNMHQPTNKFLRKKLEALFINYSYVFVMASLSPLFVFLSYLQFNWNCRNCYMFWKFVELFILWQYEKIFRKASVKIISFNHYNQERNTNF